MAAPTRPVKRRRRARRGPKPIVPGQILFSPEQTGALLSLSRTKVVELCRLGEIDSMKIDSRVVIHRDAIDAYVERLRATSNGRKPRLAQSA